MFCVAVLLSVDKILTTGFSLKKTTRSSVVVIAVMYCMYLWIRRG